MNEKQYRNRWFRQHAQYEKIAYNELIKGFKDLGNSIPFAFMTNENYEEFLNTNLKQEQFLNIYYNIYKEIGIIHGVRVGKQINRQKKEFTVNAFLSEFDKNLLNWLLSNITSRIVSIRETYLENIKNIVLKGVKEGLSSSEIATNITKLINQKGFYRWQALRIAKTETTTAANYAATIASNQSTFVMQKVWISAIDNRTRTIAKGDKFDHLEMNLASVEPNNPFNVQGEMLQYPGDPEGSASNIINCRCTIGYKPKRDENGKLIRR